MSASHIVWTCRAFWLGVFLCVGGCASPMSKPPLSVNAQAEALSHFSLGLLAGTAGEAQTALDHFEQAIQRDATEKSLYPPAITSALQLGQIEKALHLAQRLNQAHPDVLEPRLILANVYALTDQMDEAEQLFETAVVDFSSDPKSHFALARFFLSENKTRQAIQTLEKACIQHENDADLLQFTAILHMDLAQSQSSITEKRSRIQKGVEFLNQAVEISPKDPDLWQQLGYACVALHQNEEALNAFIQAHTFAPDDRFIARQLMDCYIQTESYHQALSLCDTLSKKTEADPKLWIQYLSEILPEEHLEIMTTYLEECLRDLDHAPIFYYTQLSSLYLDQGQIDEAEYTLNIALELYPENAHLHMLFGFLEIQQKKYSQAYSSFQKARTELQKLPEEASPFFTLNFMLAAQKNDHFDEAVETLVDAYAHDPVILNQYIQTLFNGENATSTPSAIDLLQQFHALTPEAIDVLYYLTLLQSEQDNYKDALENAREFESLAIQDEELRPMLDGFFYYQYAVLHERLAQWDEAERFFKKAIEIGEPATVASAQNYIAYMWAEQGSKLEEGLELIQQALVVDPKNAAFLDTLGWIYYMQGNFKEARIELEKASQLMELDPTIWEHLGDTHLQLGKPRIAVQNWEKALELAPDTERLIQRLNDNPLNPTDRPVAEDNPAGRPHQP